MSRPATATVDLNALRHNYRLAQRLAPGARALGVVKANAYGHGAVPVARALEPLAPVLAVACIEEAQELRAAGIRKPILLLEGPFEAAEIDIAARENFWLMISCTEQVDMVASARPPQPLTLWLKADTGMHRLGLTHIKSAWQRLQSLPHVANRLTVATHFAAADEPDSDYTRLQLQRFAGLTRGLPVSTSLANSAAVLAWPEAHGDFTRPGIMLYGASPFDHPQEHADQLQPVMSLTSAVINLRTIEAGETVGYGRSWIAQRRSTIATVAMGYGDGYPRQMPNGTPVLINGRRAPLAGRVSMDMLTVDVTELPVVRMGDRVELWGRNITVNEIADRLGSISYELLTRMPLRTPRVYIDG